MRRVFASTTVVLLAALTVPAAAQNPTVTANLEGVSKGQLVSGVVAITGKGSSPAGIKQVAIEIGPVVGAKVQPQDVKQNADVHYDWNTAVMNNSSEIRPNGEYVVRVRASSNTGASAQESVTVLVDNPPVVPAGVTIGVGDETVHLSWEANPEPDVVGYVVERDSGSGFEVVSQTIELAFAETLDPGTYAYQVTALRNSPSVEGVHASVPSDVVTAIVAGPATFSGDRHRGPMSKGERPLDQVRRSFSDRGLPSGIAISGSAGMPVLPSSAPLPWGSYEEELPYELPKGGVPLGAAPANIAARSPARVIPPDGLRWVAAGLLLVVSAGLLRLAATRLVRG